MLVNYVNKICNEFPVINAGNIVTMQNVIKIVSSFYHFTDRLQKDDRPTLSLLYPGLILLIKFLKVYYF